MAKKPVRKRPQARRRSTRKKPLPGWLWLVGGLVIGLSIAAAAWYFASYEVPAQAKTGRTMSLAGKTPSSAKLPQKEARGVKKETPPKPPAAVRPAPTKAADGKPAGKTPARPETGGQDKDKMAYDFYTLLPEMEVPVPDLDTGKPGAPPLPVEPGIYMLQVGAYRSIKDADAQKARLALLGLMSTVQVIRIDEKELYRVRIGPISDPDRLDEVRSTLYKNKVQFMLLREKA